MISVTDKIKNKLNKLSDYLYQDVVTKQTSKNIYFDTWNYHYMTIWKAIPMDEIRIPLKREYDTSKR